MDPGLIRLTLILSPLSSLKSDSLKPRTPNFVALYAAPSERVLLPKIDPMVRIWELCFFARIHGIVREVT